MLSVLEARVDVAIVLHTHGWQEGPVSRVKKKNSSKSAVFQESLSSVTGAVLVFWCYDGCWAFLCRSC